MRQCGGVVGEVCTSVGDGCGCGGKWTKSGSTGELPADDATEKTKNRRLYENMNATAWNINGSVLWLFNYLK